MTGDAPAGAVPDALSEGVIQSTPVVGGVERVDVSLEMAETMMMGLRLDDGVEPAAFESRFGQSLDAVFGSSSRS